MPGFESDYRDTAQGERHRILEPFSSDEESVRGVHGSRCHTHCGDHGSCTCRGTEPGNESESGEDFYPGTCTCLPFGMPETDRFEPSRCTFDRAAMLDPVSKHCAADCHPQQELGESRSISTTHSFLSACQDSSCPGSCESNVPSRGGLFELGARSRLPAPIVSATLTNFAQSFFQFPIADIGRNQLLHLCHHDGTAKTPRSAAAAAGLRAELGDVRRPQLPTGESTQEHVVLSSRGLEVNRPARRTLGQVQL